MKQRHDHERRITEESLAEIKEIDGAEGLVGGRGDGQFDSEMEADPEAVVFRVSANKLYVFMQPLIAAAFGAFLGSAISYLVYYMTSDSYYDSDLFPILKVLFITPTAIFFFFSFRKTYPQLAKRFEISRRFIRSNLFAGVNLVETTDMTKVLDISMTRLGPVVNLKIMTRDKTTPVINMDLIDRTTGEAIFGFISAHAMESFVEMRAGDRRRRC